VRGGCGVASGIMAPLAANAQPSLHRHTCLCPSPEQILNQVYWMYTKPSKLTESIGRDGFGEEGLEKIASSVVCGRNRCGAFPRNPWHTRHHSRYFVRFQDMSVIHPRKKISVMIIGNHSAGAATMNHQPRFKTLGVKAMLCGPLHDFSPRQKFIHELVRWRRDPGHRCRG
jgi:hypothetical protein